MKAWLLAAALFGFPAGANAAEPLRPANASLQVERDAQTQECAPTGQLGRAVEERLGRDVFVAPAQSELRVRVRFERPRPGLFHAALWLSDREGREVGRREISAKARHCSALDASLALVIALLVDAPAAPGLSPPPASAGPVVAPPRPAEAPRAQPTPITLPADTYAPREPWSFAVAVSGVAALGLIPSPAWGAALGLAVRPPHLPRFWVSAEVLPERRLGSAPSATLSLTRFGLMLCPWEVGASALRGTACLGQRVGFVSAAGNGFDVNQSTRQLAYDLAVELGGTWYFTAPWFLRVALAGEVPLARPAYISRSADGTRRPWFQASPIAATARLGVGVEL